MNIINIFADDVIETANHFRCMDTALPEEVADKMKALLTEYNAKEEKTFEDILDFHVKFERIHPFQDGNGRVGRLIMFKECLKYNIVPFIMEDNLKIFYYRGLKEWDNEKGYLTDTCLTAQDKYKAYLDYFRKKIAVSVECGVVTNRKRIRIPDFLAKQGISCQQEVYYDINSCFIRMPRQGYGKSVKSRL